MSPETAMTIERLLLAAVVAACAWYLARVCAAVLLLGLSRIRPGAAGAAQRCAPAALRPLIRRAMATGLIGAALTGTGAMAAADPGCGTPAGLVLDRGAACTAGPEPASDAQQAPLDRPGSEPDRYVVRPGDSLWRIAGMLRPGAGAAEIAEAWPLLWNANRTTIGEDPGLLRPGAELVVPTEVAQ